MVRAIKFWIITALIMAAFGSLAYATTLTISLDEPGLDLQSKAAASAKNAKVASEKKPEVKQVTVKVGRVGLVQVTCAIIYKSKSTKAGRYSKVGTDTPLAIVQDENGWYGVMMANGATGWILSKNVKLTGYELMAKKSDIAKIRENAAAAQLPKTGNWTDDLIRTAMQYSGVNYIYGGTDPNTGMDCSAFVRMIFSQYSIPLPRTAREQAEVGNTVPFDQLQPGDRLYFCCTNSYIDHCGIYAGNGYFVHCSSSKGVAVDSLTTSYGRNLIVAKRS
ncbi:MAG: C40 family peptidase [Armatimonadetes bacterium]|nr:C40 family peptidase [Armatimonadota bacterium]